MDSLIKLPPEINSQIKKESNYKSYIENLECKEFKLTTPIHFKLEFDDNDFIGSIDELGIYAFSESFESLVQELKEDIVSFYLNVCRKSDDRLGANMIDKKKYLLSIIEINM